MVFEIVFCVIVLFASQETDHYDMGLQGAWKHTMHVTKLI